MSYIHVALARKHFQCFCFQSISILFTIAMIFDCIDMSQLCKKKYWSHLLYWLDYVFFPSFYCVFCLMPYLYCTSVLRDRCLRKWYRRCFCVVWNGTSSHLYSSSLLISFIYTYWFRFPLPSLRAWELMRVHQPRFKSWNPLRIICIVFYILTNSHHIQLDIWF